MARIRSIKPQFWRDEKIATLKNKLAGYFFIGLWTCADDQGKFEWNPKALSLELPIFRSKEVVTYLSELSQRGLIMKSECSQWGLITNWNHQKISHPQVPKVLNETIQWVTNVKTRNAPERSLNVPKKSSLIGKDRIGEDDRALEETAHHQKTKITQKRKDPLAYMKSSFSGHTEILRDIGFKAFHQDAELILKIWPTVEELSDEVCKVYTGYGQKNNVGVDAANNPKTQRDLKANACKIIGSIISKEKKVYEQC